jgi:hypothetical protein
VHSHPDGRGWQGLSRDDHAAEAGHAAQAVVMTGLPLLGLTYATGDDSYSARLWDRSGPRQYTPLWCENVRVTGDRIQVSWNTGMRPAPRFRPVLERTISAWGPETQADLARLHIGIIGTGSVGAIVAEALARTDIEWITLLDFDTVQAVNLDRLLHASPGDARLARAKIETLARALRRSATAERPRIETLELSVTEPAGFAAALDCDVLFSCVDRPWPRAVLNMAAYAHLVPVVDGGILIRGQRGRRMTGAEWRSHLAAPGRACLECLGQYDPATVTVERAGLLDDPSYLAGLDEDHPYAATRTSSHSPPLQPPARRSTSSLPSSGREASATPAPTCTTSPPEPSTAAPMAASPDALTPKRSPGSPTCSPSTSPENTPPLTLSAPPGAEPRSDPPSDSRGCWMTCSGGSCNNRRARHVSKTGQSHPA